MARGEKLPPLPRGGSSLTPPAPTPVQNPGARAAAQSAAARRTGAVAGVNGGELVSGVSW